MLKLSKYNIISKLKDSPDYFIVNLLSGNADILSPQKALEFQNNQFTGIDEFTEKGYLVDEKEEEKTFKLKYLEYLDERDREEIQIFFVPRYACNFTCSYCYQDQYESPKQSLTEEVVNAFYTYLDRELAGRRKYVTIFGGEPLMDSPQAKKEIEWLIDGAAKRKLDVAVVTNGYHLLEYMDILSRGSIREIQVTLDGTQSMHDQRRTLKNGSPTFARIVNGIDVALEKNFPVNLRVVVDKENIKNLPELAEFAIQKGWTKNALFKTQLGRNYELHTCQLDRERLFSRLSLYQELYEIINKYPRFLEFHRPAYSVSRFLFENGELPEPLFDDCPGAKSEWAFDYTGQIYACTATVGKSGEELGTFFPSVTQKEEMIEEWEDRDIMAIPACKDCAVQLACGGGCASVAKNRHGNLHSPDCRPVKELLELGLSLYFQEEIQEEE